MIFFKKKTPFLHLHPKRLEYCYSKKNKAPLCFCSYLDVIQLLKYLALKLFFCVVVVLTAPWPGTASCSFQAQVLPLPTASSIHADSLVSCLTISMQTPAWPASRGPGLLRLLIPCFGLSSPSVQLACLITVTFLGAERSQLSLLVFFWSFFNSGSYK